MIDQTSIDVTSEQLQELRASEARYRRLFETAKDGIFLLDADTARITDVNPYLQDMLGYSYDELTGKALWEIGPVQDIVASQDAMRHLQQQAYVRYENLPLQTKAGHLIAVEFISNVYLVGDLRVIQCNVRDITARKLAEEEVQSTNDKLLALVAELQKRDEEMKQLIRLNELLQSCLTLDEARRVIAHVAIELFTEQSGCLAMLSPENHHYLETITCWGDAEAELQPSFLAEDCWAIRRGRVHEVGDPRTDLLCPHFVREAQAGSLCVPLITRSGVAGLLCLTSVPEKNRGSIARQQLAVAAGETIKLSLSSLKLREELREQAIQDPLTGLYNRRFLEDNLGRELYRAQRGNSPLCVVMLDLDNFKAFNDTLGHDIGDAMLRELAGIINDKLRKSDICCRYGGDEFLLVLLDSSLAATQQRVDQICTLFRDKQSRYGDPALGGMTLSAGIAGAPEHGSTPAELIRMADNAMYVAKNAGGNRIVVYQTDES